MRRFLRLLTLWLLALALPVQGAAAATAMSVRAHPPTPAHMMTLSDGTTMDASAMPCHAAHAVDKSGCGACCGPIAAEPALLLAVAPVAARWAPLPHDATDAGPPQFLTGGTERPPRLLA